MGKMKWEKRREEKWKSSPAGCVSLKDERWDDGKNTCENMHYINTITYIKHNRMNNINIIYIYKYT